MIFYSTYVDISGTICSLFSAGCMKCFEWPTTLCSYNKVCILWVSVHIEAADELARKEERTPLNGPGPFCGIGNGFVAMTLKNIYERLAKLYWANLPGREQSRLLTGGYETKRTKVCLNLTKKKLRIIVGELTSHCRLNKPITGEIFYKVGCPQNG